MATPEEHTTHDDAAEKGIIHDVEKHGFSINFIEGDGYSPSFGYTIGLFKTYGYPELICFGLNQDLMHSMFWTGKELFNKQSQPNPMSAHPDFLEGYDVRLLSVDKARYPDYLGYAHWFYSGWDFPALQIVWPDRQALFPWEEGFNPDWKFKQPLLDRDANFKFREERNVAVFTTSNVLAGAPILRVVHDAEGDWQFLCDITTETADMRIVCLEEITKQDPTVNELFELNYGWSAWRDSPQTDWERWEQEEEEEEEENEEQSEATEA